MILYSKSDNNDSHSVMMIIRTTGPRSFSVSYRELEMLPISLAEAVWVAEKTPTSLKTRLSLNGTH